jgi:hypothetical protein
VTGDSSWLESVRDCSMLDGVIEDPVILVAKLWLTQVI